MSGSLGLKDRAPAGTIINDADFVGSSGRASFVPMMEPPNLR
jgi:hypothetical protein